MRRPQVYGVSARRFGLVLVVSWLVVCALGLATWAAPSVLSVTVDTDPIYEGDLTQQVTVTFDEAMDVGVAPVVTFGAGTWAPADAGAWSSGTEWTRAYTVTDNNEESAGVTVDVTGAQNALGVPQNDYAPDSEFDLDTAGPSVLSVAVDTDPIYDGDTRQRVTVTFDEPMDTEDSLLKIPQVTFSAGTWSRRDDNHWNSDTEWSCSYLLVTGTGLDVAGVTVDVAASLDAVGNVQENYTPEPEFDIDTLNPTVVSVAVDTDPVCEEDLTQTVTVAFDEAMDTSAAPTITFSAGSWAPGAAGVWNSNTEWVRTYSVSDANQDAPGVTIDVADAVDAVGNLQEDYTPESEFDLDTLNPSVASVAVDTDPVCDSDLTQFVTVTFDEAMNTAVAPTLAFGAGSWTPGPAGVWNSSTEWFRTYTASDAGQDIAGVTVDVTGGVDSAGNAQQDYTPEAEFDLDTKDPTVTNVVADTSPVYDGDPTQQVTVAFSEEMDASAAPSIVFSSGTWAPGAAGTWSVGNTVWSRTFTLSDANAAVANVTVDVSDAQDAAGNSQHDYAPLPEFDIDTENPTVTIAANDLAIYDGDVGTDRFTVAVTFSEAMNPAVAPTLTFTPGVASTFMNPSGVWSVGNTVYTWTYDVADSGTAVADVDVAVSGARDVAGNTQVANTNPDYVDIDTQNPTVAGVSSSDPLVADADAGGSLVVTVDWSESMSAASVPTFVFTPSVVGTLTFSSGLWVDADTYQATYAVSDANTDADSVTVDVISGKDLAGNDQANYAPEGEFGVDTLNPTVTSLAASDLLIADSDAGLTRYVTVDFSEAMDTAVAPAVAFAPDVASTLTSTGGSWSSATRYRASYTALDANVDVNSVTVDVTAARDAAVNAQQDYAPQHEFEIDTLNPTVAGIALSDSLITDADVGGTFTVTIDYSEAMTRPSPVPIVAFVPGLATTLSLLGTSAWLDADTYVARYTILDGGVTVNDDDVQMSAARDVAGNLQIANALNDDLDVDTENPIISAFAVTGGQVGTKSGNDCVREVTFGATVTDPNGCMNAEDISVTSATVRTGNASITAPYDVVRMSTAPNAATIEGAVDVSDLTGCPAVPRIVLDATDCVGNAAAQASAEDNVYDAVDPTIQDFAFATDGSYATPTTEYEVDDCCVTTVYFSAGATDNCCIGAGNIGVTVTLPTSNAVLENVVWDATQAGQKRVNVVGRADVRCLSSCSARVEVAITAYDCCGNDAVPLTSAGDEGLVWDRRPPLPADDPNGFEPGRCDRLEVRRDDAGQFRLMIRENTPTYIDVLCNDTDNCSACTCCASLWIYDIVDAPEFGIATIVDDVGDCHGGTSVRYAPNRGYLGPDRFTYRIIDACGNLSQKVTAYLETVREVDLSDVFAVACAGAATRIDVRATDLWIDPDRPEEVPFRFALLSGPSHGAVVFSASDVRYEPPSLAVSGGQLVPTLTFMESATLSLQYTPALDFVGQDALRVALDDPYGGRAVGNVDILVNACPGSGVSAAAPGGRFLVIVPAPTFEALVASLSSAMLVVSLDDGGLYTDAVKAAWSPDMARHVLVLDTQSIPAGTYEMRLDLGNGDSVRLWLEVGESL